MHALDLSHGERREKMSGDTPQILVVDDSRVARSAIKGILDNDFQVAVASDGAEAWEILTGTQSIQVVISDLVMPRQNGFQLLRLIRESVHARINRLPVIIITGHEDDDKLRKRAMFLGASDFITKPFDALQIKVRARSYARHGDTARKLDEQSTIDDLTGLGNARYFQKHGAGLLAFAARQQAEVAILRLDVDRFEPQAEKLGRAAADRILVNIGKMIKACTRTEDAVARIGVAKFAVIMPGANEHGARVLAERIHRLINQASYRVGRNRFRMTASAGLVWRGGAFESDLDEVVHEAEARLASAIEAGGARLVGEENPERVLEPFHVKTQARTRSGMSLDEAVLLLRAGQSERLRAQARSLGARVYPLLVYLDRTLALGMSPALKKLGNQIKGVGSRVD